MITQQVTDQIKEAMKAKEQAKLSTLRMLKSAFMNKETELGKPLTDEDALTVIKAQVKQLKDALVSEEAAGRAEESASLKAEIAVLETYLPAQMSDEAIRDVVGAALSNAGIASKAEMGKAMGVAMKAVAGQADGTRVKAAVEALLTGFAIMALIALPHAVFAVDQAAILTFIPLGLRIARAFLLLIGIICVNSVIMGGFDLMVAGGRDEGHHHAMSKMTGGLIGSLIVAALFSAFSVVLGEL